VSPVQLVDAAGALTPVTSTDVAFTATDGCPLAGHLWHCNEHSEPPAVALINAGAGIGSAYYDRFARYLSQAGVPTLLYDYRGIGRSRPRSLKGFSASVEDWGSKDCAAALEWLSSRFPGARRVVIGHSVGGFVTGFVTNGPLIDRMLLVGAHTGYWRDYALIARPGMYMLWHVLMPSLTRVVGYFPGRRLHLSEDLPAGVAMEWANRRHPDFWWNRRTPDGALDTEWRESALGRFQAIRARTLSLSFSDDAFATEAATDRLVGLYRNCSTTRIVIRPGDAGRQKIGHFGFFRSRFRDLLWPQVVEWVRSDDPA
jgi:predicted alpha/beta hydrolase